MAFLAKIEKVFAVFKILSSEKSSILKFHSRNISLPTIHGTTQYQI
jgi:hypothetical protein